MSHKLFLTAFFIMTLVTSACSTGAIKEGQPLPELTFKHLQSVPLAVSNIRINTSYDSTRLEEDISGQLPVPPDVAIRRYANQRFKTAPGFDNAGNEVIINIENAKVTKRVIEPEGTFSGWFGINKREEYKTDVKIEIRRQDANGYVTKRSEIFANRILQVPESLSLAERDAKQLDMIEALINEIDPIMIRSFIETFGIVTKAPADISSLPEMRRKQDENSEQLKTSE